MKRGDRRLTSVMLGAVLAADFAFACTGSRADEIPSGAGGSAGGTQVRDEAGVAGAASVGGVGGTGGDGTDVTPPHEQPLPGWPDASSYPMPDGGDCEHVLTGNFIVDGVPPPPGFDNVRSYVTEVDLVGVSEVRGNLEIGPVENLQFVRCLNRVSGNLTIGGRYKCPFSCPDNLTPSPLTDLRGLEHLERVGGTLMIEQAPKLRHLDGLQGLRTTGTLSIQDAPALEDLEGLSGLTTIYVQALFTGVPKLTDLSGLASVTSLGSLEIDGSNSFESLHGLEGLTYLGGLAISHAYHLKSLEALAHGTGLEWVALDHDDVLPSLKGLPDLKTVTGFEIAENKSLSDFTPLSTIETVSEGTLANLPLMTSLPLTGLRIVSQLLRIEDLDSLESLSGLDGLESAQELHLRNMPHVAQCEAEQLAKRVGSPCSGWCDGLDTTATCP